MLRFISGRLLAVIPVLFVTTFFVFVLLDVAPGDAARSIAGPDALPEVVESVRRDLKLDDPLPVRYGRFVSDAVQGDLGRSLRSQRPVADALATRLPITFGLFVPAVVLALVIAIPAGVLAAVHRNRLVDRIVTGGAALLMAVPSFVLAVILVVTFAVKRDWFPATGYSAPSDGFAAYLRSVALPAITLAGIPAAEMARMTRSSFVEALDEDYIRTARSKGLRRRTVLFKHAAKNAAIPVVTALGINVAALIGGSILVERVFAIPGFGSLVYESVLRQDVPMIMGVVVVSVLIVLVANLLVDLSYGYLNPKIRDER